MTLAVNPVSRTLPVLPTGRNSTPLCKLAELTQTSTVALTHPGTGIVRMWPPLPMRSATTQWSSRSSKSSTATVTTSARRSPQPISTARTARLRVARSSGPEGEATSFLSCSAESQLPTLTPSLLAPFTRQMPAARSGLRRPQSDASYASRRTAASRRLIVAGAYLRCSKAIRSSDDGTER